MTYEYGNVYLDKINGGNDEQVIKMTISDLVQKSFAASRAWEYMLELSESSNRHKNKFDGSISFCERVAFLGVLIDEEYDFLIETKGDEDGQLFNCLAFDLDVIPMVLDRIDLSTATREDITKALIEVAKESNNL